MNGTERKGGDRPTAESGSVASGVDTDVPSSLQTLAKTHSLTTVKRALLPATALRPPRGGPTGRSFPCPALCQQTSAAACAYGGAVPGLYSGALLAIAVSFKKC